MPDGDRFQWRLKGKGWRKLRSLLTSGVDDELIGSQAITAVAHYLKDNPDTPYADYVDLVHRSLATRSLFDPNQNQGLEDNTRVSVALENLAEQCDYSESSLLAQRAASRIFLRMKSNNAQVERSTVAEAFAGGLAGEITERRCLALVREDTAQKCGRSFEDEMAHEKQLRGKIAQMAKPFTKKLASTEGLSVLRAP